MPQITDISPTAPARTNQCVTGRMLSVACSPDGTTVFVGSYANLWASDDGGQNFTQVVWPQPPADQFSAPGALGGWCAVDIAMGTDSAGHLVVLALMSFDRTSSPNPNGSYAGDRGIWRSGDRGATWTQVHQFQPSVNLGQLEWVQGSDHLVYAAGSSTLAISQDAGLTFVDVLPFGDDSSKKINHVAVWPNALTDSTPEVIYVLGKGPSSKDGMGNAVPGNGLLAHSFDKGTTWIEDLAALPNTIGSPTSAIANSNTAKVMAISPLSPRLLYITADGNGDATAAVLYLFDYSNFAASQASTFQSLSLPGDLTDLSSQDSGHVFLAATRPGQGDFLFYGGQRSVCYVAALSSSGAANSWHALDSSVHFDLHGLLLSPDFSAEIVIEDPPFGGITTAYGGKTGTAWLLTDGGLYRSTDGGNTFVSANGIRTLGSLSVAGASIAGSGPVLSLNNGDNDGFYSLDGGNSWKFQDYGGGDNDCAFADPMQPNLMFVCTPRRNGHGDFTSASLGQTVSIYEVTPGSLPNASNDGTSSRHVVTGPLPIPYPLPDDATNTVPGWNAGSAFYARGSRPIVLTLVGEESPAQGDYIFVLNPFLEPVLVRSQSMFNISSRDEWTTTATEPFPGANVYLQGPSLPAPRSDLSILSPSLGIVQASGGHSQTVLYVGGDGTLQSWQEGQVAWKLLVPASTETADVSQATRFFVSPYLPSLIYVLDTDSVKRSDDGGQTWRYDTPLQTQLTWNGQIPIGTNDTSVGLDPFDLLLTDMKFDPSNPLVRFAVGQGGAFYTVDGVNWTRLLHAGALPGRPSSCYYDPITNPANPALYVAFSGRGVVRIDGFPISSTMITVLPTALTFAETQVGTTSVQQQTVTVFTGSATITGISFVDITGGASADYSGVPSGGSFGVVDGQVVITIFFRPKAGGNRDAWLEIAHNAAGSPLTVLLTGLGDATPTPLLGVSPLMLSFNPKRLTPHTVTLTNKGNAQLVVTSMRFDNPNYSLTTTCNIGSATLNPGDQCTVTVRYNFIGQGGSSNLIITHNAPGSPTMIDLEATSAVGTAP